MDRPDILLKIVPRKRWHALPPSSQEPLKLPAKRLMFMFTETKRCETKEECVEALQGIQRHYMDKGMPDLPFSFLVGGDLRVYEGRGWNTKINRDDIKDWKDGRIVVGYICEGKDDDDKTDKMIERAYDLMYYGIDHNYLEDFDKERSKNDVEDEIEKLQKELAELQRQRDEESEQYAKEEEKKKKRKKAKEAKEEEKKS